MHMQGSAFKSGLIKKGDVLVSVNGQLIGADSLLAGSLIRFVASSGGHVTSLRER
jgi:C-terminal processing protease CtpA/Prc